jgi:hypothetical protein
LYKAKIDRSVEFVKFILGLKPDSECTNAGIPNLIDGITR